MSVEFKVLEHIITTQHKAEEVFLAECKAKSYTLEAPYVLVNPYGIAPLTALLHFSLEKEEAVTIIIKGKESAGDITFSFAAAKEHFIPLYGLYAGYKNTVEVSVGKAHKSIEIQTEEAPEKVKAPVNIETTAEYMGNLMMFVSPTYHAMTAAYDYKGDVRWYMTLNLAFDIKRVTNGRLLVGTHRLLLPPYHTTGLFEMGMIGKIYKEYRLPGGYHHDQFEMEDGNLLILTQDPPRGTVEDMCVLVDRKTGDIIKRWDYQAILPQDVGGSGSQDAHDWFHNNAVWYDKKTHSLSLSGRHQDIVININYDTGALNWIIGDPDGWPQELVDKYFFKPVGDVANFDWQYEQHACVILPDGDVMCFDNGHWRAKRKENYVPAKDNFSRGVRYRIDTDKMEIEQVWQYGKERGSEFFSTYICNVEYYGEGHYMVHSGGAGSLDGEACNIPPVGVMGEDAKRVVYNSYTVEIKDDKVVYELQLPANYYRAEKLSLYAEADKLSFGKGELLGSLGVSETFDTIPEVEDGGEVPAEYKLSFAQEEDRLVVHGLFEKGQLAMLLLEGAETLAYFIPTTKRPFLAMCVGTFLESDARSVEHPVSLENVSGEFDIKFIIDDKKYSTDIKIKV